MTKSKRIRRKVRSAPSSGTQPVLPLGPLAPKPETPGQLRAEPLADFIEADPGLIRVGAFSLDEYLRSVGLEFPLALRDFLISLDWSSFFRAYSNIGRRPLHPRLIVGLVLYGLTKGVRTLRELEQLARVDVGAWWVAEGQQPDHSTIGKFLSMHAQVLSEEFFVALTSAAVENAGAKGKQLVGASDGTVVESAASRFGLMKKEALREVAAAKAAVDPGSREAATLADAARVAEERCALRKAAGKDGNTRVSPTDPEAMVQPRKDGVVSPSFKPTIITNELGLILGQRVDPSNETATIRSLLAQYEATMGASPSALLLDGGYFNFEVLNLSVELDLNVLVPSGKAGGTDDFLKEGKKGLFPKSAFRFDESLDAVVCPAGRVMNRNHASRDNTGPYVAFQGVGCDTCPLKAKCTTAAYRRIRRYEADGLKDAMQQVLQQPAARREYTRRKALVEPKFGTLKERHRLRRFTRRGLRGAQLEFALHCMAFNVKKGLEKTVVVVLFSVRRHGAPWRVIGGVVAVA